MNNFKGQLFRGRLFAGRLFRGPQEPPATVFPGQPLLAPRRRQRPQRRDRDDDVLMFLLR